MKIMMILTLIYDQEFNETYGFLTDICVQGTV